MGMNTKRVTGRRSLRFQSLAEVVADAEQVVSAPAVTMLGNWRLDQLLMHLAIAMNSSIDGISARAPWYMRMVGPFLKQRLLTHAMPAGFILPKTLEEGYFPACESNRSAFEALAAAIARTEHEAMTASHPVLGKLTHDEWRQLHLRHAELHLSFALPVRLP